MFMTKDFKTRSEIKERKMPRINGNNQYKGKTIIAEDIGYSSVKFAGPDRVGIIPSYAKKADKDLEAVAKVRAEDIQLRNNKTGEVWLVGQNAQALMNQNDIASTTDMSLYTRYRYKSEVFKVIATTGICLALWGTDNNNEVFLQTGLPAEYKTRDEKDLIAALCGDYNVSLKVGNKDWVDFQFILDAEHIDVMEQPKGTLCAVAYKDGELTEIGKKVMKSNSMIHDVGFGTEDDFSIRAGYKDKPRTYADTGMRAVFEKVIEEISQDNPIDVKIFEFQKYLEEGTLSFYDPNREEFGEVHFEDILERLNKELGDKSMKRLMQEYSNMVDYHYLVVTGGTGESRYENIKKFFEKHPHLEVLPGNLNTPDLPFSYSNVIGYYMFRHAKIVSDMKKSGMKTQ